MTAFDTNLVVRIATGDNPSEKAAALTLLEAHPVLILKTVLLETEWVLRSRYQRTSAEIGEFLTFLIESEGVVIEEAERVQRALRYYRAGADFADALHLASAGEVPFYTLDKAFCRPAIQKGIAPAVEIVQP